LGALRSGEKQIREKLKSSDFNFEHDRFSERSIATFPKTAACRPAGRSEEGVSKTTNRQNTKTRKGENQMGTISNYLKMNASQLEEEINKQNRKISSAKETIALLKKLQIAASVSGGNPQQRPPQMENKGGVVNGEH